MKKNDELKTFIFGGIAIIGFILLLLAIFGII